MRAKLTNRKKIPQSKVGLLLVVIILSTVAAVAVPSYNDYIRTQKEKMALNLAAVVAQSANAYYSQNEVTPTFTDLNVRAPSGYRAALNGNHVIVSGDGCAGYVSPADLDAQSVQWRK